MNKTLGIDIDGVLTLEGDEKNNIWQKALCEHLGCEIKRKKDVFNFIDAYDLSEEIIQDFLKENIEDIYKNVDPAPGARSVLKDLARKKFKIYLITARQKKFNSLTLNWLKKNEIPYDELYHDESKAPIACQKNIELFVEDNLKNAKKLLKCQIAVIIFDRYHNRSLYESDRVFRAKNWIDIKKIIYRYFGL